MSAQAKLIAELKRMTGAGVAECRQALVETGGDLVAARDLLARRSRAGPANWIMEFGGRGPDHFLELGFDGDPRGIVRATDTTGFRRAELRHPMFSEFRAETEPVDLDLYVDEFHFDRVLGNLMGRPPVNVWTYQAMQAGADRIWIEHGYGSVTPVELEAEMRVVASAVRAESPRLRSWSIEYGGQGYERGVVASGASAESLRAYLGRGG